MCFDIVFTVLNIAMNKIEPNVVELSKEVNSIASDIGNRTQYERMEVIGRTYRAKLDTIDFIQEIKNKIKFFRVISQFHSRSAVALYEVPFNIKFLE